uniref:ATP synthase subunit b n=1 Tax=Nonomuraea gerenzanensis TaxID=93944 RepID=Q66V90_9ACTN|nr:ATP synthase B chain [Nonomuraea gerenzanensis]
MIKAATLLAAEEGANPLIPHTYELVVGIFSFAVVVFVVGRMLVPRIQKTLAERTDAIEGGIRRAEEAQAEAQALQKRYSEQLEEARRDAARLREEAREQAAQIKAELREEAQAEARRLVEAAHAQIEADRQAAFRPAPHGDRSPVDRPGRPHRRRVAGGRGPPEPHRRQVP